MLEHSQLSTARAFEGYNRPGKMEMQGDSGDNQTIAKIIAVLFTLT